MYLLMVALLVTTLLMAGLLTDGLPKQYVQRTCQGFAWRRQFPTASKESIRSFLSLFTAAFAFKEKHMLKFGPNDELMKIYRALYPSMHTPDALELETLNLSLVKEYGVSLQVMWHEHLTLGELFSAAVPPNKSSQPTPYRGG
jgi:propanediol dehydratase small subunit